MNDGALKARSSLGRSVLRRPFELVLFFGAVSSLACAQSRGSVSDGEADATRHVTMETLVGFEAPETFTFAGEVVSVNRVEVSAKVAGTVTELPVTEGMRIERGDVIARVDAPEYASALVQARADEAAIRVAATTAERHAARYRRLAEDGVVSPRDLELAELSEASAAAQLEGARARLRMATQNMAYADIHAPESGVVVERRVRRGDLATPGRPLVVIEAGDREILVTLPADVGASTRPGDAVVVSGAGIESAGVVDRVTPDVSRRTQRLFVRVPELSLPSGSFVDVRFAGREALARVRVPREALRHRASLTSVFVVDGDRAVLRYVRLDDEGNVLAGLRAGDRVVLSPPSDLRDGDRVTGSERSS